MNCHKAIHLMHEYLDDDLDEYSQKELFHHLGKCAECSTHFNELKSTEQLLKHYTKVAISDHFTEKVLNNIPRNKQNGKLITFLKKYPVTFAASIFLFLFSFSLISFVTAGDDLVIVSGSQHHLIVEGDTVIVPEGQEINGDLVIENGNLEIKGEVNGNVTVVNGKLLMANASYVDGYTEQIDQLFERILYKLKMFWNTL